MSGRWEEEEGEGTHAVFELAVGVLHDIQQADELWGINNCKVSYIAWKLTISRSVQPDLAFLSAIAI